MVRTDGRDGERNCVVYSSSDNMGHALYHLHLQTKKTKGYPTLVSSFNAYNKQDARKLGIRCGDTPLSCHVI